jgi:hypothetical protein
LERAENRPYNLRPRKDADKTAPGAGVEALPGAAGKAGAPAQMTFRAVDVKPTESDEEYSDAVEIDAERDDSDLDRYELRSVASVSDPLETGSPQRDGNIEEELSEEGEDLASTPRAAAPRSAGWRGGRQART